MKLLVAAALLASLVAPIEPSTAPTINSFRYSRVLLSPSNSLTASSENACAILDADVFAHASIGLPDLRVFDPTGGAEIPYVITLSSTPAANDIARIVRATLSGARQLDLDLEMPHRPYSEVDLSLNERDFVASAHVTGLRTLTDTHPVFLGDVTLFDLTARHLGGSTAIPIAESTFPYLHLRLTFSPAPDNRALLIAPSTVVSAQVPAARLAQTLYTTVAQSTSITERGQQTVVTFTVPAHVPVERVSFDLEPAEQSNFDRAVSVSATTGASAAIETLSGQISRVHLTVGSQQIQQQSLSIPAILGSNAQSAATVQVAVRNGRSLPLKIRSVRLEMRQRQLCFPAPGPNAMIAYGSASMQPATYDFARTFNAAAPARRATMLDEHLNTLFISDADQQSRFKRSPAFFGLATLVAICLLAVIAYRALLRGHQKSLRR